MHDTDIRSLDIDTTTIRNSMIYTEEFVFEDTNIGEFPTIRIDRKELYFATESCFIKEFFYKSDSEWGSIDRWESECWNDILESSNMVEMAMSYEHTFDTFCFSEKETDVRQNIIESRTITTTSKFETTINQEYFITMFDHSHIGTHST